MTEPHDDQLYPYMDFQMSLSLCTAESTTLLYTIASCSITATNNGLVITTTLSVLTVALITTFTLLIIFIVCFIVYKKALKRQQLLLQGEL